MPAPAATAAPQIRRMAGLDVLTWPVFDPLPVDAVVTTRAGGVSSGAYASLNLSFSVGDEPANVAENRRRAAAALGADVADFVFARQVHGNAARIVTAADRGAGALRAPASAAPRAGQPSPAAARPAAPPASAAGLPGTRDAIGGTDALVTAGAGTVLAILAADCVPMVLYDPAAHVLGCAHAGWRGTLARVACSTLAAMRTLGARPDRVIAGVGPAVAPDRYRVGDEVAAGAARAFGGRAAEVLRPDGSGGWLLDLWAGNRLALREAGVPDGQIHLLAVPTGPDPGLLFSHRAERPCGRFALLARLRDEGKR